MAAREPDPRYAARFQRGWTGDPGTPPAGDPPAPSDPASTASTRRTAAGPALVAALLVLVAAGALAWACLDPAFTTTPRPDALAAARVIAAAAPGPLAAAIVVAVALAVRAAARRVALPVAAGLAVGAFAAVGAAAVGIARLASLTAQGPVSSGGIPLPDSAMAVYEQRVQAIGMLTAAMPGLILASALALLLLLAVASRVLVPRPAA